MHLGKCLPIIIAMQGSTHLGEKCQNSHKECYSGEKEGDEQNKEGQVCPKEKDNSLLEGAHRQPGCLHHIYQIEGQFFFRG